MTLVLPTPCDTATFTDELWSRQQKKSLVHSIAAAADSLSRPAELAGRPTLGETWVVNKAGCRELSSGISPVPTTDDLVHKQILVVHFMKKKQI